MGTTFSDGVVKGRYCDDYGLVGTPSVQAEGWSCPIAVSDRYHV